MDLLLELSEKARRRPRRIVLPEAQDARVRQAAATLKSRGIAEPVLLDDGRMGSAPAGVETVRIQRDKRLERFASELHELAVTDLDGQRVASYPDVITTLDGDGSPVSVGHLREGMELAILRIAKDHIPLSASVTDPSVYPIVEEALGLDLTSYALGKNGTDASPTGNNMLL